MKSLVSVILFCLFIPHVVLCQKNNEFQFDDPTDKTLISDSILSVYNKATSRPDYILFDLGSWILAYSKSDIFYDMPINLEVKQQQTLLKNKSLRELGVGLMTALDSVEASFGSNLTVGFYTYSNDDLSGTLSSKLGFIRLIQPTATSYSSKKKPMTPGSKVTIIDATIGFSQGYMNKIILSTSKGKFELRDGDAISILQYDRFLTTPIYSRDRNTYVYVGDIIDIYFSPKLAYGPNDTTYFLTNLEKHEITQVYGLNNLLELEISTDLLGLFESEDNGLVIFDLGMNFPLNLSSGRNRWDEPWAIHYFRDVNIAFRYVRLDQANQGVVLNSDGGISSSLAVIQRSDLSFRGDLNLLKTAPASDRLQLAINFFGELNSTQLSDTIQGEDSFIGRYNTVSLGFGIKPSIWRNPSFGIHFHFDYFKLIAYDDFIINDMPPNIDVIRWGCKIEYFTKSNKSSSIFGKFNMVDNISANEGEFYQFSIGYKLPILSNQKVAEQLHNLNSIK